MFGVPADTPVTVTEAEEVPESVTLLPEVLQVPPLTLLVRIVVPPPEHNVVVPVVVPALPVAIVLQSPIAPVTKFEAEPVSEKLFSVPQLPFPL